MNFNFHQKKKKKRWFELFLAVKESPENALKSDIGSKPLKQL